jgi:UDP-3-O-[3-hydroxymyristoyl] glucosamine N-acyltransferase
MHATLAELADFLKGEIEGDERLVISGIAPLERAQRGDLTFLTHRKYARLLATSQASAVLVGAQQPVDRPAIRVPNPFLALITLLERFFPRQHPASGIDTRAVLEAEVHVGHQVSIGAYAVIGRGTRLGDRVIVYPGTYIGEECVIGDDCVLYANVSLYARVHLGRQVVVHSGAVIGADGFGFYPLADGSYRKIPQVGRVVIGDAVEIGANTCIDRAMLGETVIESGVKLDNLVQIGHNTRVGAHSVLASQVGLSGSVRVGPRVRMGGQVGVIDHVTIGEGVSIVGQSGIAQDVEPDATVWGSPAVAHSAFKRTQVYSQRLSELFQDVKQLRRRLEQLEARETKS